jgi:hypothetical protein
MNTHQGSDPLQRTRTLSDADLDLQKQLHENLDYGAGKQNLLKGLQQAGIQRPSSWWLKLLTDEFEILHLQAHQMMGPGFWVLVAPRA